VADKIVVNLDYVAELKTAVDHTTERLEESKPDDVGIPSDPTTEDHLHDFMNRWDKRRGELSDTLKSVGSALGAMHDAFDGTDNKLTGQITCQ
jgi:hypothetical protein